MSMNAARIHEIRDAGPAFWAAPSAPSNHPDPMIEPSEMNMSPKKPMLLRKSLDLTGPACAVSTAMRTLLIGESLHETFARR